MQTNLLDGVQPPNGRGEEQEWCILWSNLCQFQMCHVWYIRFRLDIWVCLGGWYITRAWMVRWCICTDISHPRNIPMLSAKEIFNDQLMNFHKWSLVGGLVAIFYFPMTIGNNHPNSLIFIRGVAQPPTRSFFWQSETLRDFMFVDDFRVWVKIGYLRHVIPKTNQHSLENNLFICVYIYIYWPNILCICNMY